MATQPRFDTQSVHSTNGPRTDSDEPQMRTLLKQLASEGGDLVRSEMALAKLEMREMGRELALDSVKLAGAIGLALIGVLALLAAAIIGLGNLLGGLYALSALIIGALMLITGGVLARTAIAGLKNPPKPEETVRSLQRNKEWAAREVREFKEEIRS
ncbi:hypothetical protein BH23GEM9_BH23GEM9_05820 [soil metagenome]